MEDTTFATFVVGAAFGSLAWYWLRRLTRELASDEDIIPLRLSHSIRAIEKRVSVLLVLVLLWLSAILLDVPNTWLPQWIQWVIPHEGYLHNLATRKPIGYLFLGFLFGLLLGEWLSYIFLPPQLRTDALRDSHTRWGYFLVGIVALGLLYPLLLPVLRTLKGGDVKTPVGSLSFGVKEPEKGARIQGVSTQGLPVPSSHLDQLIDKNRPLGELPFFEDIAHRDLGYAKLFLEDDVKFRQSKQPSESLEEVQLMHTSHYLFIKMMQEFGICIKKHWDLFHSVEMISQQIRPILPIYTGLVLGRNDHLWLLKKAINKSAQALASDIIFAKSNLSTMYIDRRKNLEDIGRDLVWSPNLRNDTHCWTAAEQADTLLASKFDLPYAAFGLAHLFYDAGEHQQAARVIADWLDAQYWHPEQFDECKKNPSSPCTTGDKYPGITQYPIGYKVSGEWKHLPIWYRIRMEYELGVILEGTDATRSIVEAYRHLEASYKELFDQSSIYSAEKWMDHCSEDAKQDAQDDPSKARLVLAFLSTVAERIQYQVAMVDNSLAPVSEVMTEQVQRDGKLLTSTKFDCFSDPLISQDEKENYKGSFYAQYGTVLALSATAKEGSWELERIEQKRLLTDARLQLENAIQILTPRAELERSERYTKPLRDQLFYLGPSQDVLRTTQGRLDQVIQALR